MVEQMRTFARAHEVAPKKVKEGIEMRVLVWSGKLMMTQVSFKKVAWETFTVILTSRSATWWKANSTTRSEKRSTT